jgi:hypothetical protein
MINQRFAWVNASVYRQASDQKARGSSPAGVLEKVEPVVPNAFAHFVQNNTGTSIRPENYSATFKGDLGIPEHNALNLSKLHLIDLTNLPVTSVAEPSTLIDLFTSIIRNFYFYS